MWVVLTALLFLGSKTAYGCTDGEYAPHPSDCNKYLVCNHGAWVEMSCGSGLYWNAQGKYCDWPASSGCTSGGGQTTTTQRPTSTTTQRLTSTTTNTGPTTTTTYRPPGPSGKKLICYFTDWAWYRTAAGKYSPDDIDPTLCTHIVYSFILLDASTSQVKIADSWADVDNKFYEKVTALRRQGVHVTIAVGGWTDSEGNKYSQMMNDPGKRGTFVRSVVDFVKKWNFEGVDLDLEYPACWQGNCDGGPASDKQGFSALVTELRQALPAGSILSAAVSASKGIIPKAYDVPLLSAKLDWIGVMDYDFHGPWDGMTGHIAPLYYKSGDKVDYFNVDSSIEVWTSLGADPAKLIVGVPTYGKSFTLSNSANNGLNAPTSGAGNSGRYTNAAGTLAYYEICANSGWTVVQDSEGKMGPYAYSGNQWVSYDDPAFARKKVAYLKSKGLGGAMVWSLDFDDFNNQCGGGRYPVINALKQALNS
ncbi:probable chitinase 10 [Folsomia candida]|uniref:probable chitinase 10 n=1 Tax=Folsomia candida TaxID=158441 RepID=UPI000B901572|nr:probable chitinase 10 [Folsomia candida]